MKPILGLLICYALTYGLCAWFGSDASAEKDILKATAKQGWVVVSPAIEHQPYRGPLPRAVDVRHADNSV